MTDIAMLGFSADTSRLVKAEQDLDKVTVAAGRASKASEKLGQETKKASDGLGTVGGAANKAAQENERLANSTDRVTTAVALTGRQLRLSGQGLRIATQQLSQVGQQSLVTGNFVQALAVQLPDLGLAFGAVGAAAGLFAAVVLPTIATAIFGVGQKAKTLDDAMQTLGKSFEQYKAYVEIAATSTAELTEKFGAFASEIKGFSEFLSGVALAQTFDDLKGVVLQLQAPLADVTQQLENITRAQNEIAMLPLDDAFSLANANDALQLFTSLADDAAKKLGILPQQAKDLAAAIDEIGKAKGPKELADSAAKALAILKQISPTGQDLPAPLREAAQALEKLAQYGAEANVNTENTKDAAERLNTALAGAYGLYANLRTQAAGLANETLRAAMAAASLNYGKIQNSGQSGPDAAKASVQALNANAPGVLATGAGGIKSITSGGGAGASATVTELQKIADQLDKLTEPFDQAKSAYDALDTALSNGVIGNEQYISSLDAIEAAFLRAGGSAEQWGQVLGKTTKDLGKQIKDLQVQSFEKLGSSIADLVVEGKANFGDLAKSIVKDLINIAIQAAIVQPLLKAFGFADGGVTGRGAAAAGVIPFAKGGAFTNDIYNSPTLFRFAKGGALGVMGEAGPEAVMPLKRGPDGSLGVQINGAVQAPPKGSGVVVNVVNNADNTRVSQSNRTDGNGIEVQDIIIDTVREGYGQGNFDDVQQLRYGSSRKGVVR